MSLNNEKKCLFILYGKVNATEDFSKLTFNQDYKKIYDYLNNFYDMTIVSKNNIDTLDFSEYDITFLYGCAWLFYSSEKGDPNVLYLEKVVNNLRKSKRVLFFKIDKRFSIENATILRERFSKYIVLPKNVEYYDSNSVCYLLYNFEEPHYNKDLKKYDVVFGSSTWKTVFRKNRVTHLFNSLINKHALTYWGKNIDVVGFEHHGKKMSYDSFMDYYFESRFSLVVSDEENSKFVLTRFFEGIRYGCIPLFDEKSFAPQLLNHPVLKQLIVSDETIDDVINNINGREKIILSELYDYFYSQLKIELQEFIDFVRG